MIDDDAIERAFANMLHPEGDTQPGDDARLQELIDATLATPPVAPAPTKLAVKLAASGGTVIVAVAALILLTRHPKHVAEAPPVAPVSVVAPIVPAATIVEPTQLIEPPPVLSAAPTEPPRPPTSLSAEQLFARANEARRKGRDTAAIEDYRTLQKNFPSSPEAIESHVALGRLLQRGDAAAALREFDRYLADPSAGTLKEEAMIGRAQSLGRLGREDEARRAWQRLLDTYPDSIYADQARAHVAPR
jgi:TolA-binding protein